MATDSRRRWGWGWRRDAMPLEALLLWLLIAAPGASAVVGLTTTKKVMLWWANPNNATRINATLKDLQQHHKSFTGFAYQAYAVCGAGSNFRNGSNDCSAADASGAPHFAPGHPVGVPADLGARIRSTVGASMELWPVISYGNPGCADVLNALIADPAAVDRFADAAIKEAHAKRLTGYNLDLETSGVVGIDGFLQHLVARLHSATPSVLLSYDDGIFPVSQAPLDRWISMGTYTSDINGFRALVGQGFTRLGPLLGVGLCPSCFSTDASGVKARLDAVDSIGKGTIRELDVWAHGTGPTYDAYWAGLEAWLASSP